MGLTLRRQRDGKLREYWYGEYQDGNRRRVVNLNVKWKGTPPESLRTPGDKDFERTREKAQDAFVRYVEDAHHKGRVEHLTERLIESKSGVAPEYVRISDLLAKWTAGGGYSPGYMGECRAVFGRFVAFMQTRNPRAVFLYQVKPSDVSAFAAAVRSTLSPRTCAAHLGILRPAFSNFLPVGATNPFAAGKKEKRKSAANQGEESVHRIPFSPQELQGLLSATSDDPFMAGLITAAACTGMRRGDVCGLKWADVDLKAGIIAVKSSKTGAQVEIPIFNPLRTVLMACQGNKSEYVFPEAAKMLAENPDGLTYRFKKIVAKTMEGTIPTALPASTPPAEVEAAGIAAISKAIDAGARRDRLLDTFKRYCAGAGVRRIERATGRARSSVSTDLHAVEDLMGAPFLRGQTGSNIKASIARLTRSARKQGQRSASTRDWHALRTTFVTLALSAGVPLELVRRVTGHATVEIVLKHYFRPGRAEFKAALTGAMPSVITGGKPKRLKPADELAALSGKLAAGSATEEDKDRLRKLAAAV